MSDHRMKAKELRTFVDWRLMLDAIFALRKPVERLREPLILLSGCLEAEKGKMKYSSRLQGLYDIAVAVGDLAKVIHCTTNTLQDAEEDLAELMKTLEAQQPEFHAALQTRLRAGPNSESLPHAENTVEDPLEVSSAREDSSEGEDDTGASGKGGVPFQQLVLYQKRKQGGSESRPASGSKRLKETTSIGVSLDAAASESDTDIKKSKKAPSSRFGSFKEAYLEYIYSGYVKQELDKFETDGQTEWKRNAQTHKKLAIALTNFFEDFDFGSVVLASGNSSFRFSPPWSKNDDQESIDAFTYIFMKCANYMETTDESGAEKGIIWNGRQQTGLCLTDLIGETNYSVMSEPLKTSKGINSKGQEVTYYHCPAEGCDAKYQNERGNVLKHLVNKHQYEEDQIKPFRLKVLKYENEEERNAAH
ncbi:hypothetical protein HDU96_004049, partial [Phlyctochytrium bullatum]